MSGTPLSELQGNEQSDNLNSVLNEVEEEYANIPEDGDYDEMEKYRQAKFREYQHDDSQTHYYREADEKREQELQIDAQEKQYMTQHSWGRFLVEQIKSPTLFVLLFLLLNWKVVEHLLLKYLPPSLTSFSLVMRALLGALLFYLTNTFVLPML